MTVPPNSCEFEVTDEILRRQDALAMAEFVINAGPGGVEGFLGSMARRFNAFGAVIFELTGPPIVDESLLARITAEHHRLFVMAAWFDTGRQAFALDDLSVENTTTGEVLKSGLPKINRELPSTWPYYHKITFFKDRDITQVMSVRIPSASQESEGKYRTLNLYRQLSQPPFSEAELQRLNDSALLVDSLLERLDERLSLKVMLEIDEKLLEAESRITETTPLALAKSRIQACCQSLEGLLDCCEVSAFVSDTSNAKSFPTAYCQLPQPKQLHPEVGLTRWVLAHKKPIHILDLRTFERDRDWIHQRYPGAEWNDSGNVVPFARQRFGIKPDEPLPPLSYMAAPIKAGEDLYGVIRCSVRKSSPSYFSLADLRLLESVANRLGQVCRDADLQSQIEAEQQAWKALAKQIAPLNSALPASPDQRVGHIQKYLERVQQIIPQSGLLDVRLVQQRDQPDESLKVVARAGAKWNQLSKDIQSRFDNATYPTQEVQETDPKRKYSSLGAKVFKELRPLHTKSPQIHPCYARLGLIDTQELVVVPILYNQKCYGVLDLHRMGLTPFPSATPQMALLLASQLGLHLKVLDAFEEKQYHEDEMKAQYERQGLAHQDLGHQLKTPLGQLVKRIDRAVKEHDRHGAIRIDSLFPIRGLSRKVASVAYTMRLLSDLHRNVPIKLNKETLNQYRTITLLSELTLDAKLLVDPDRKIDFWFDRESVEWVYFSLPHPVRVDHELLKQCLTNLLDNAGKYSYPDTVVQVWMESSDKWVTFVVENQGIPLTAEYAKHAADRDWRSPEAVLTTGEGSGIGLWIVDQIMQAQGGTLESVPTDELGKTEFRLNFPI